MPLQEEMEQQGNLLFKYRSNLPLIILVLGLVVHVYSTYTSAYQIPYENYYQILCLGVCLFGLVIRIMTVGHTPKNTSGRNTSEGQVADQVNTTGIYSLMRHPLYVGNFFMWLGIAMLTHNVWFVIAFTFAYWVYYERIMFAEEQFLRGKFGDVYLNWASKVPAFVPKSLALTKNKYPFSWKKVLRQEKNGFAAIFILLFVFELSEHLVKGTSLSINSFLWFYPMVIGSIIYLILKFLKRSTNVLTEEGR